MQIATNLSNELARYLDLDTRQIQLTANNMANIDTPGYRTVGMDFEAEMRRVLAGNDLAGNDLVGNGSAGNGLDDDGSGAEVSPRVFEVDGLIVRPDGNNVSMDRESLNLAEAQLKFKTGVALLKSQYTGILNAIHADAK
jgi:flagellar basal-body rod protein FlgB